MQLKMKLWKYSTNADIFNNFTQKSWVQVEMNFFRIWKVDLQRWKLVCNNINVCLISESQTSHDICPFATFWCLCVHSVEETTLKNSSLIAIFKSSAGIESSPLILGYDATASLESVFLFHGWPFSTRNLYFFYFNSWLSFQRLCTLTYFRRSCDQKSSILFLRHGVYLDMSDNGESNDSE